MKTKTTFTLLLVIGAGQLFSQLTISGVHSGNAPETVSGAYDGPKEYAFIEEVPLYQQYPAGSQENIVATRKIDIENIQAWQQALQNSFLMAASRWGQAIYQPYEIEVKNLDGLPVPNITVILQDEASHEIWKAKTNNLGRALLWASFEDKAANLFIQYLGQRLEQPVLPEQFKYAVSLNAICASEASVDLMIVMDATGSMRNELQFLKEEWWQVLDRLQGEHTLEIREGVVFYRDYYEEFLVRSMSLGSKPKALDAFVSSHSAEAGGDDFEAVIEALEETIYQQTWNPNALARLAIIMLDAPPRNTEDLYDRWHQIVRMASAKGITIIPVVGMKAFGDLEYLMRSLALATNSSCFFLSGNDITNPADGPQHIEWLEELLLQELLQSTENLCRASNRSDESEINAGVLLVNTYPNPSTDHIYLTISDAVFDLQLTNVAGFRTPIGALEAGRHWIDLSEFPPGSYVLSGKSIYGNFSKTLVLQ